MNKISIAIGKLAQTASRLRGGGSAFPGLVVEKINPSFVRNILEKLPYGVIVISGTNGKTTTTKIISEMLQAQGLKVFTNDTGSNFVRGVISSILDHIDINGKFNYDIAVLELDEAHAVKFCEVVPIRHALFLNVQRDQLDRFGEIDHTAELLQKVADVAQDSVVLNREDPRISKIKCKNPIYFGLSDQLLSQFPSDDDLLATTTDKKIRHHAKTILADLFGNEATYKIAGKSYTTKLALRGIYNAYNAAGALALCQQILPKVNAGKWLDSLAKVKSAFGRGEIIKIGDLEVEILLVKNPSAFQLSLKSFVDGHHDYMIAINDNFADGQDMSWLWNVDFTLLTNVMMVSGVRAHDMALRLKYDEITAKQIEPNLEQALPKFITTGTQPKRIFTTYTAMLEIRKILSGRSIL